MYHEQLSRAQTLTFVYKGSLMIQFAKAVFSENSLCMPEFSIPVKMLHKIFGHNTDCVLLHGFQQTVLHDLVRDKFLYLT